VLGGQLLAEVLGTPVSSGSRGEKGNHLVTLTAEGEDDPLFRGITSPFLTYQWHNDSFDLPVGCVLLATSGRCSQQTIRYGDVVYGLQFHPEVTADIASAWLGDKERIARFLPSFLSVQDEYFVSARILLLNFFRIAGLIPQESS
jgi:GMP synthase (glutamine-hydrolysing)